MIMEVQRIGGWARENLKRMSLHLDGAQIWNAVSNYWSGWSNYEV